MSQFLINAAAQLRKMSHHSETEILLKNQTWILVGEKNNDDKYIFNDNGEVVIELNGVSNTYKWAFTSSNNKLEITGPVDFSYFILYIDKSVVVLQRNLEKQDFVFLANVKYLQKADVETYIHSAVAKQLNLILMHVTDGFDMEIHRRHAEEPVGSKGQEVTRDLKPLSDGMYKSSSSNYIYEIQDSVIVRKNLLFKITLSDGRHGDLYTENKAAYISLGDKIIVDQKPLDNGKYFFDDSWFVVDNAKIRQVGTLKKYKTGNGVVVIEQNDIKPATGDLAYLEGGAPYEGEVSLSLFKKVKISGGKVL